MSNIHLILQHNKKKEVEKEKREVKVHNATVKGTQHYQSATYVFIFSYITRAFIRLRQRVRHYRIIAVKTHRNASHIIKSKKWLRRRRLVWMEWS